MGDHRFNKQATELEARLAAGNTAQVKDRLGRDLAPGDHVLIDSPGVQSKLLLWRIVGIKPNLDPSQPQATNIVQMIGTFNLVVPKGLAGTQELLRVLAASEVAQAPAAPAEPPDPPTEA